MSEFDIVMALVALLIWCVGFLCGLMFNAAAESKKPPPFGKLRTDLLKNMGDCDTCGEWTSSLNDGQCAVCRKRMAA